MAFVEKLVTLKGSDFSIPVLTLKEGSVSMTGNTYRLGYHFQQLIKPKVHELDKLALVMQGEIPHSNNSLVINCSRRVFLSGMRYLTVRNGRWVIIQSIAPPHMDYEIVGEIVAKAVIAH
ncbi:MAG: hypothetical protein AAGJ37_15110 [Pseudomonadota bacterium]